MRISDWSSDVCSSDLVAELLTRCGFGTRAAQIARRPRAIGPGTRAAGRRRSRDEQSLRIVEGRAGARSEEHTSELQSLKRNSYADFCLKKNNRNTPSTTASE